MYLKYSHLEYIIFRGTDICDLNVCDLPNDRFPQDPAILSATTQPPAPIGQPGYGVQGQNVSFSPPINFNKFLQFPQSAQSPKSPPGAPGSDAAEKERHDSTSEVSFKNVYFINTLFQRDRRNNNQRNAQNYDNRRTNQNNQRNFPNRNNQNKVIQFLFILISNKKKLRLVVNQRLQPNSRKISISNQPMPNLKLFEKNCLKILKSRPIRKKSLVSNFTLT